VIELQIRGSSRILKNIFSDLNHLGRKKFGKLFGPFLFFVNDKKLTKIFHYLFFSEKILGPSQTEYED